MQKLKLKSGQTFEQENGLSTTAAVMYLTRILCFLKNDFYKINVEVYTNETAFENNKTAIDNFSIQLSFAEVAAIAAGSGVSFFISDGNGGLKINESVLPLILSMQNPYHEEETLSVRWEILN